MIYIATFIWTILLFTSSVITVPQCGYPCLYPMLPMPPPPPPPAAIGIPIPMPVPVGVPIREKITICCSTTEKGTTITHKNLIPIKLPQFPMPPGMPIPFPMPIPPPVVMIPLPPLIMSAQKNKRIPISSNTDSTSSSDSDSSSSDSDTSSSRDRKRRRYRKRKSRYGIYRRYRRNNVDAVKPVLTYLDEDGHAVYKRYLTKHDEQLLMKDNDSVKKVKIIAGDDRQGKSRVLVVAKPVKPSAQMRAIGLRASQDALNPSRNKIVFRPAADKKITNLSVAFNIEK